ncbi:electron transfer flavoprotein-ubiquinone oxidoreductase [Devosia ginsengisoli]|uniref:Electron transfer flavoprotein-ubiquinone oxidoreductase n=1 Tax=Devosia ginsengisoli TaxID=400770 RepID=A0A5B8LPH7_9HYPH|nr:electron transfer flavoprotein-ubiquinone oxidoreductase [Devosia ginsengisoli]QDZ10247.1 electron transfer flavoprotein-ubiquinone oxidoreductase [Devosia ginsengisoli]
MAVDGEGIADDRESMDFDVVVVGAGPAGLAAAIRLKQLAPDLSVVVLEKGAAVGAHILSGAVIDPSSLDELLPGWRDGDLPLMTEVTSDRFDILTRNGRLPVPNILMPPLMSNHGNLIVSLGDLCRWLGEKAEALGVEIYPGFAATEVVYNESGAVRGVATGDMGISRDGTPGPGFARGMKLLGKYVLMAEGVRGSLSERIIERFELRKGREPPKYGLGIKELWEVRPEQHRQGQVHHSFGWPLGAGTGGGSFLYHLPDNLVAVGLVVHLNYSNPYLSPFEEFQRFKTHKAIAPIFAGGKRVGYGARAISEGGWQSVPRLSFPGGLLLGCAAGLVNVPRIKGFHNASRSGMLAAEHVAAAIAAGRAGDEISAFEDSWRDSTIGQDLWRVRNVKPLWSRFGTYLGIALGGLDMWCNTLFKWSPFGTIGHSGPDHAALDPAAEHQPIQYDKPDGVLTFDRLSSVFLSNTNHEEDQPVHLHVLDPALQRQSELEVFQGPSTRYCPAAVYEWQTEADGSPRFVINAQNCVHCKTCDIKDPNQNIRWVPPQGGEGPVYPRM